MFGRTSFGQANLPRSIITDDMAVAIDRWVALYYQRAPWLMENRLSLGLPAAIAREISNLVTLEAQVDVSCANPEPVLNPRAQLIKDSLEPLLAKLQVQTEYACAFGGVAFKPYVNGNRISINCTNADNFYPTTFDPEGRITGAVFIEKKITGKETYIRVEHHELSGTEYAVTNKAYRALGKADIGTEIPLASVPEWADIQPETHLEGIETPLFAYFKIPHGNVVDVDSQLGVSVYARADMDGLLREVDLQYQRLSWEFEGGELAIHASKDAFKTVNNLPVLPRGKERLYRLTDIDPASTDKGMFDPYAPELRDQSFSRGLNEAIIRVEDACGIARGTFSNVEFQAKTATEIIHSKQRTYATVSSIQLALQRAIEQLAEAINTFATLYSLTPEGDYNLAFKWDDSIVVDAEAERVRDLQEVGDGIMQKWEYRVKWYGETEEVAKAALEESEPERAMTPDELMQFRQEEEPMPPQTE